MGILKQIEELQKKIDELKVQHEKQESMFKLPLNGKPFFFVGKSFSIGKCSYSSTYFSELQVKINNAFTDKVQAKLCAKHLRDTFWFTRKAIEFADGYEFVVGVDNFYIEHAFDDMCWVDSVNSRYQNGSIYMNKESANKFCEWLNKHKPNGWK